MVSMTVNGWLSRRQGVPCEWSVRTELVLKSMRRRQREGLADKSKMDVPMWAQNKVQEMMDWSGFLSGGELYAHAPCPVSWHTYRECPRLFNCGFYLLWPMELEGLDSSQFWAEILRVMRSYHWPFLELLPSVVWGICPRGLMVPEEKQRLDPHQPTVWVRASQPCPHWSCEKEVFNFVVFLV